MISLTRPFRLQKKKNHTEKHVIVDIWQEEIHVGHTDNLLQFETVTKCDYLRLKYVINHLARGQALYIFIVPLQTLTIKSENKLSEVFFSH